MIDGIDVTRLTGGGIAVGVVLLVVVALVRGWLVPGNVARMFFEAWQTDRHTVEKLAEQTEALTKGQQTVTTFIGEIKAAGAKAADSQERSP